MRVKLFTNTLWILYWTNLLCTINWNSPSIFKRKQTLSMVYQLIACTREYRGDKNVWPSFRALLRLVIIPWLRLRYNITTGLKVVPSNYLLYGSVFFSCCVSQENVIFCYVHQVYKTMKKANERKSISVKSYVSTNMPFY